MKILLMLILLVAAPLFSQHKAEGKETILDNRLSLEDSIYYKIDTLSRLCDNMNIQKNYIDIDGCRLYCETEGEGIPIVLIHGGPGGTHHYFHPWFSEAKDFAKVIYYDQRGCGQSDFQPDDGYTFRQAVDDLHKLKQKLAIEKWIVCGYSYGGAAAQYYSAVYPDDVLGMVLISASPVLNDEALNGSRQQDYILPAEKKRIKEIYQMRDEGKLNTSQTILNIQLNGDWKRQDFQKPTKDEIIRAALYEWTHDKSFNQTMSSSFSKYDFKNVFNGCPIPTLICEGRWDLTWKADKAQILKNNHPDAELVMFENSGHSIFHDEPGLFFTTLKNFMESIEPVSKDELDRWHRYAEDIIQPQEKLIEEEKTFFAIIENEGVNQAVEYYLSRKTANDSNKLFTENGMNRMGYKYLQKKDYDSAIALFKINVEAYPDSWNVYDSLGEAYLANGDKEMARKNYERSLELNPDNNNAQEVLNGI